MGKREHDLKQDIKDISRKLDLLIEHLGIGKTPPATTVSIKKKAQETARALRRDKG